MVIPDLELDALPALILMQNGLVGQGNGNAGLAALQHGKALLSIVFPEEILPDADIAKPYPFEASAALAPEAQAQGIAVLPQHADVFKQEPSPAEQRSGEACSEGSELFLTKREL